ncbi:MAG TPA: RNA ligase family protein [Polyangiaceae bacterium]|nr:RNA ligase family protein [Polyangiaceae bacterium]
MVAPERPLGRKAYFKIAHLPGSRTGSSDRTAPLELAERCLVAPRPGEEVLVQEKLDGSCVAVARLGDAVLALGREGTLAAHSGNPGRQMFAAWVEQRAGVFRELLDDGEWLVGEWLALAHSTRYELRHEPFVVFDAFHDGRQWTFDELDGRLQGAPPRCKSAGRVVGMAKYVRGDKVDGALLPENSGRDAVWNWKPKP